MKTDGRTTLFRARTIEPMCAPPIDDGAVAIRGDLIAEVGTWREVRRSYGAAPVHDLGEQIILPGLINAHCHLDYTDLRGVIPPQRTFTEWVEAVNARKAKLTETDYLAAIANGFAEAQKFGTTTIVNIESFPRLLPKIAAAPLRTWWCAELIDVRAPVSAPEVADQLKRDFHARIDWNGGVGLSPHAPFTASRDLYREAASVASGEKMLLTTHLAESSDETAMFRDCSGPLFELMNRIGRPMDDCGARTSILLFAGPAALDERWIVAHLNEVSDDDFQQLAAAPKFHIAHCPRSHAFFGHTRFQLRRLQEIGFNICLGTDSLASNDTLSLFAEMQAMRRTEPALSAREVLEMVTLNAARALHREHLLGSIEAGGDADLIALPISAPHHDMSELIVNFDATVPWLMVGGDVLTPG